MAMDVNMCVKDKIRFAFLLWNYEWASVDHNCATYFLLYNISHLVLYQPRTEICKVVCL